MLRFYYRVWLDCITTFKAKPANKNNWALFAMIGMSLSMHWNFVLFMTVLQKHVLGYYFYELNLSYLPSDINALFSYIILFTLPCVLVNYLLIFRNKRYEKLLEMYPYKYNGKLFVYYFVISMFLPVVLLLIGMIFF